MLSIQCSVKFGNTFRNIKKSNLQIPLTFSLRQHRAQQTHLGHYQGDTVSWSTRWRECQVSTQLWWIIFKGYLHQSHKGIALYLSIEVPKSQTMAEERNQRKGKKMWLRNDLLATRLAKWNRVLLMTWEYIRGNLLLAYYRFRSQDKWSSSEHVY